MDDEFRAKVDRFKNYLISLLPPDNAVKVSQYMSLTMPELIVLGKLYIPMIGASTVAQQIMTQGGIPDTDPTVVDKITRYLCFFEDYTRNIEIPLGPKK